jgi:hypothetical protein
LRVTVPVVPLNDTVAILSLLEPTLGAPHVPWVTVNVLVVPEYVILPLVGFIEPLQLALATLYVNVLVDDFFDAVAGQVTVITLSPAFAGVNVIVPLLMLAVATPVVALDTVGVAPLEQVAVNVLFVPYVPFTIVLVEFVTVVVPSVTVVVLLPLAVVAVYCTLLALY